MKRLLKPLLFLAGVAVVQVVIRVLGIVLKGRFLSQQLGEGEINAVGVRGKSGRESHVNRFQRRRPQGRDGCGRTGSDRSDH